MESSKRCRSCADNKNRKVERPSFEELSNMLSIMSICSIARHYGVSDNAVRKWIKKDNILHVGGSTPSTSTRRQR